MGTQEPKKPDHGAAGRAATDLLACPQCHCGLRLEGEALCCDTCRFSLRIVDGVLVTPDSRASAFDAPSEIMDVGVKSKSYHRIVRGAAEPGL